MIPDHVEILQKGDDNGNGLVFRLTLPLGLEVVGLPTRNFYGGEWDLGPTWNYLVLADRPFLVDTGRYGTTDDLIGLMALAGVSPEDLDFIALTHGHEDHDGGLADLADRTGAGIRAHAVYGRLIRYYPDRVPEGARPDFPASCWHCNMPRSFSDKYCLDYHRRRSALAIDPVVPGNGALAPGVEAVHLPGHTPDSLVYFLGREAALLGDVVLPHISPFPSTLKYYGRVAGVLVEEDGPGEGLYGLSAYIRSLKILRGLARSRPGLAALPGHRLYYGGRWHILDLEERIDELLGHHVSRCSSIMEILRQGPDTPEGIALKHFEDRLLEGPGLKMAENEIISHCELLEAAGDLVRTDGGRFGSAGGGGFEAFIEGL